MAENDAGPGGALRNSSGSSMFVTNTLFIGNTAATGGAIENAGTCYVVNSTFSLNAANQGSGIDAQGGDVHAYNSIFWQNAQAFSGTIETSQISCQRRRNARLVALLIQGLSVYAGNGNVSFDPLFLDPAGFDFELSPFSPAVDAGSDALIGGVGYDVQGLSAHHQRRRRYRRL